MRRVLNGGGEVVVDGCHRLTIDQDNVMCAVVHDAKASLRAVIGCREDRLKLLLLVVRENGKRHERVGRDDSPVPWLFEVVYLLDVVRARRKRILVDERGVLVVCVQILLCRPLQGFVDHTREDVGCL